MGQAFDVVVVGSGNAGLCAALAAAEGGARTLVLERAPREWRGGNSHFTAGAFRFAYRGLEDVEQVVGPLDEHERTAVEVGSYSEEQYYDDLCRVTQYRCDPELADRLVSDSFPAMCWMRSQGVRFELMYGRQAFQVRGRHRFWGGLIVESVGGGADLVRMLADAAEARGVTLRYDARARRLLLEGGRVRGVKVQTPQGEETVRTPAVVLASGGFEASAQLRAAYLGPDWDLAKVRGTPYNTGDGIVMGLEAGAEPYGHWSGCHAVAWDQNAPAHGDRKIADGFQKHSYPFGIMVNREGRRFVDEGADFRNYTYAKYGREILRQSDHVAFQLFDRKVMHLLRDEYRIPEVTRAEADTIRELARRLEIDADALERTVAEFNAAVQEGDFDPTVKDGKAARGITPPKSNWALRLDEPPFVGYGVTCGITFTFGGLRVTPDAKVLDTEHRVIPGLFACGELVGGLFYHNYPGGTGLMSGTVFGRRAGQGAARLAESADAPRRA